MSVFERTFTVSVPPPRAWRAFTDPEDIEVWFAERFESGGPKGTSESLGAGGPMHFEPTEVVRNERLAYKQWAESPESGIVTTGLRSRGARHAHHVHAGRLRRPDTVHDRTRAPWPERDAR